MCGKRGSEGELVGEFLLESIEEAIGDAHLTRHVLGMVGGHAYQAHRVHNKFLHQDQIDYIDRYSFSLLADQKSSEKAAVG